MTDVVKLDWTPEQIKLITSTVAKGATPDELKLFLYRCQNMGLDPLKPGQIHFIKYGTGPGTVVIGIEGFRSLAARTGKLAGIKRGVIRDDKNKVTGAWAEIYRTDWKESAREEVSLQEYDTGKGPWVRLKETMIKKVAECAALRMAFPDDLGGVYEQAEMDQAERDSHRVLPEQPENGDGIRRSGTGLFLRYGRFANQYLNQIDPSLLKEWIIEEEDKAKANGKKLTPFMQNVIKEAEAIIGDSENKAIEQIQEDRTFKNFT